MQRSALRGRDDDARAHRVGEQVDALDARAARRAQDTAEVGDQLVARSDVLRVNVVRAKGTGWGWVQRFGVA